jgi:hypothetical protein
MAHQHSQATSVEHELRRSGGSLQVADRSSLAGRRQRTAKESKDAPRTAAIGRSNSAPWAIPASIDETTFLAATEMRVRNLAASPRNKKREYRLSGHVVCGWCRKRYAATTIHDQPYSYSTGKRNTRCPGKRNTVRGERCDNLVANGVVLEADVWARVDAFLSDPSLVAAEVERQQGDSGLAGGLASDLARIDPALQRFAGQEQRLITLFRFGEVDEAMITRELTASVRTVRSCKVSARTW